jgi:AFG3 family protein
MLPKRRKRKLGTKKDEKEEPTEKSSSSKEDKDKKKEPEWNWPLIAGAGLVMLFLLARRSETPAGDEVSFQDVVSYLEKGRVDRIQVVAGGSAANVFLKPPTGAVGDAQGHGSICHFFIGSVDSFERKLQDVQDAMGLDPRDYVPVSYANPHSTSGELMKMLPTFFASGSWILHDAKCHGRDRRHERWW